MIDGTRIIPKEVGKTAAYTQALHTAIDALSHNPARVEERAGVTHAFIEASTNEQLSIPSVPFPFSNQMGRMFAHAIFRPTKVALHPESVVIEVKVQTKYPWEEQQVNEPTATFTFDLAKGLVTLDGDLPPHHESTIGGLQHPIYSDVYGALTTLIDKTVVNHNAHVVQPLSTTSS